MAATVYQRLHSGGSASASFPGGAAPGAVMSGTAGNPSSSALLSHSQLTRSLERILEEAHFSGELILTNRKLKDFPKTGTKYALTDTVIADLSRNRFCELPEEVTTFAFLETLLLYHNTIRSIPESVKQLSSLTYLDLRSNQLSSLPREICFLPLQVLLVSNNRLSTLPDEMGRLDQTLTDLDASYNQLANLPARLGELRSLRSLSLRSNHLMYLPRELTCLSLVSLDVSNNRIASLPLEIRHMATLVELQLENNPLTSPPASLCMRGLVHVFKFLETQATKDEKGSRSGGNYDGYTTLRRAPRHNSSGNVLEASTTGSANQRRHQVDSGYSTSDGLDKRWSHDVPAKSKTDSPLHCISTSAAATLPRTLPSAVHSHADLMDASLTSSTSTIVDESLTLSPTASPCKLSYAHSNSSSNGSSPDQDEDIMLDHQERTVHATNGKSGKSLGNIQTYKEYKEALKQQRNQEMSVYKQKHPNANHSPNDDEDLSPPPSSLSNGSSSSNTLPKSIMKQSSLNQNSNQNGHNGNGNGSGNGNGNGVDDVVIPKKPIQKVIPSRNTEIKPASSSGIPSAVSADCLGYVKPQSPMKNGANKFNTSNGGGSGAPTAGIATSTTIKSPVSSTTKLGTVKTHRSVTWNHDIPAEKLSFTMRREFDRQREETELMSQLRSIIETRLKMTLPVDIASALTDGVILCHLANYVRPRSVASIHVPSPGVNKLTMARCRRNVDNFLEACRRIGVDEELICSCEDVVPDNEPQLPRADDDYDADVYVKDDGNNSCTSSHNNSNSSRSSSNDNHNDNDDRVPNALALLRTVSALIALDANPLHQQLHHHHHLQHFEQEQEQEQFPEPTITCSQQQEQMLQLEHVLYENGQPRAENDDGVEDRNEDGGSKRQQQLATVGQMFLKAKQKTYEKIKHNLLSAHGQHSFQANNNNRMLHTIVENEHDVAAAGPAGHYQIIDEKQEQQQQEKSDQEASTDPTTKEAISKRIEFFEQQRNGKQKLEVFSIYLPKEKDKQQLEHKLKANEAGTSILLKHDSHTLTVILSCVFMATFLWLVFFPLPG